MTVMAPSRIILGLIPVLLFGCYESNSHEADVDMMESVDASDSTEADLNENATDVEEIDGEDEPSACDFGPLMDAVQFTFNTHSGYRATNPVLAFTGSEFAVAWNDNRNTREESELFFTLLSPSGEKIIEDIQLSNAADPGNVGCSDVAFTGSELGLVLGQSLTNDTYSELFLMRLSPGGERIADETRLTFSDPYSGSGWASIAFAGSEYGVLWQEGTVLMFMRIDLEGNHLGEDLVLDTDFINKGFSLIYGAGEFVMVWEEDSDAYFPRVFFARISDDGVIVDGPRDQTWGRPCGCPSIAFSGAEFGVVCERYTTEVYDNGVYFFRLSIDGWRLIFEDIRLTDDSEYPHFPKIIHNESGHEYAVVWLNNNDTWVYLDRLAEDGTMKGDSFRIAHHLTFTNRFQIVPKGPDYVIVWEDGANLAFARFGCIDPTGP